MAQLRSSLAGALAIALGAAFAPFSPAPTHDRPEAQGAPTMVVRDLFGEAAPQISAANADTSAPTPETDDADTTSSSDDNRARILGFVLNGLALLALIGVLVIVFTNRRRSAAKRKN